MDITILIIKDGDGWYAEGKEVDYAAYGATLDDAIRNFEVGLALTVALQKEKFGSHRLLRESTPKHLLELERTSGLVRYLTGLP